MITGSIVAIVTAMKDDSSIDWDSYRSLIEFHIENGTNAIVVVGTTGESATLNSKEHGKCIEFVVRAVNKRIPVIAGTGANATKEAIYLAKVAADVGADAHLSVAPYYNKPSQRGLLAHFTAIAKSCELPLILYNVPSRTCSDIAVKTVVELANVPNIVGIKEASTIERCRDLLSACPKDFAVYSGHDPINCQVISEGAAGAVSVTANIVPKMMSDVCRLAKTDFAKAKIVDNRLQALHDKLFVDANPVPVKWVLSRMGMIKDNVRLPLVNLAKKYHTEIEDALYQAGVVLNKKI